jgi:glycosyltransferase involved in cell wall biosynthesis
MSFDVENKLKNKNNFKVAVLLPIMNEVGTLERCLTSLVNQSLQGVAIIIQDNFSDDGSDQIIAGFKNSYPNVFTNTRLTRIDSWENWDQLLQYAEEFFDFEYLFWMGGDDYLAEIDFFQNLYLKGIENNLDVITPTINNIDGKTGVFKGRLEIKLQSKFKLFRMLKYSNNWENVNILHSLIRKTLYQEIIAKASGSHTQYIANDWWFGANIVAKNQLVSTKNAHFCKSHWEARRYSWINKTSLEETQASTYGRYRKFRFHLFQDFSILRNHIFIPHPLKNSLTSYEFAIILVLFVIRTVIRPPMIFVKWLNVKCQAYLCKPLTSGSAIN